MSSLAAVAQTGEKQLVQTVVAHCWSPDKKQLAIAPNTTEVYIYSTPGKDISKWEKKHILTEHEGFVSALDWSSTGKLVTCGHDRNAYVWEYDEKKDEWNPTLVILRINRAATDVKWSPSGVKFAVASGAKCVPICHYEKSNNWWISKMIKNHKSTVTSVAWSPNSYAIATGCTDYKARIHSAYIEELDTGDDDGWSGVYPKLRTFGEQLAEFGNSKGWVNAVTFSPSGATLAFSGHGSTIHFADAKSEKASVYDINQNGLPYLALAFTDENTLIAVGYDANPAVYTKSGDKWAFKKQLDSADGKKNQQAAAASAAQKSFSKWADADKRGQEFGAAGASSDPLTRHTNAITAIRLYDKDITTSGLDGRILFWTL